MSWRLAADKRPDGQMLQSLEGGHKRDSEEPGGPKVKPRNSKRSEGADTSSARGSTFPVRSTHHNNHISPHSEKDEFRQSLQKNVFIDSYYPVVWKDCSEASRNGHSSYEEIDQADISTDCQKSESSWETDSGEAYRNPLANNSFDPRTPSNRFQSSSSSSSTTLTTICPTLDSKTYTVLSCSSDLDSTFFKIKQRPCEDALGKTPHDDHQISSTVGCFSQLYNRIHNLEDLLQQTIEQSLQRKQSKCTEAVCDQGEPSKPVKKKFSVVKKADGMVPNWDSIPEVTNVKGSSDTENELQIIKKRLKILERKLKKTKQTPPPPQSFTPHRNPCQPLASNSLVFTGIGDRYCVGSKDTDSTVPLRSETESFLHSEVLLLNGGSFERSDGDSCNKKIKTKVRKKFISNCRGIRKMCGGVLSSGKKISSKNNPMKTSTTSGWSEVLYKRSILTEESVEATLLSQSFSTHPKTDSSTVVYFRCQQEGLLEPPHKPRKKNRKKQKYLCKKSSRTNILSFPYTELPKKKTLLTSTPATHAFVFGDCDLPPRATMQICDHDKDESSQVFNKNVWPGGLWKGKFVGDSPTWEPQAFWIPYQHKCCSPSDHHLNRWHQDNHDCTLKTAKPPKKRISFRNPLNLLKRGDKLKIPVLFEEVCKTPDSREPGHKFSNVSMRFVVVEEANGHPLTPLRKLINKLSQPKPPQKGEHFVFGVSKCRCDNPQVQKLGSISQRNVTSGFS